MSETYEAIVSADVRTAIEDDEELFLELWEELIADQKRLGSDLLLTQRTMDFFAHMFRSYVQGIIEGVVVFGAFDNAVLMWGKAGELPWDSSFGKWANGWGTYVRPEYQKQGWSKKIREEGKRHLKLMGFEALLGGPLNKNNIARESCLKFGGRLHQEIFLFDLR